MKILLRLLLKNVATTLRMYTVLLSYGKQGQKSRP